MNKVLTGLLTIFFLSSLTTNYAFSGASSSDISSYNMKVDGSAVATLKSFDGGKVSAAPQNMRRQQYKHTFILEAEQLIS